MQTNKLGWIFYVFLFFSMLASSLAAKLAPSSWPLLLVVSLTMLTAGFALDRRARRRKQE